MRPTLFVLSSLAFLFSTIFFVPAHTAEVAAPEDTPWTGTYLKFAQHDTNRKGQFGEAEQVTITKGADGYYLNGWKFTETEKGVLTGGLGTLYLGYAEFADGKRYRVLRAQFCYEQFILYSQSEESAKKPVPRGK